MIKAATVAAPERAFERVGTAALLLVSAAFLVCIMVVCSGIGAVRISVPEILRSVMHPSRAGDVGVILFNLRLPRVLAAALAGAGLSATGVLFQGLFRNPLADPFVLGASGGAALGGTLALFLVPTLSFAGVGASALFAFVGALLTMAVVWSIAGRDSGPVENMLLAGFAIGTLLSAATSGFEFAQEAVNPGARILSVLLYGQIGIPPWEQIGLAGAVMILGIIIALPVARKLNALALGEEFAAQLGVPVLRVRIAIIVLGALLTALAVSLGGLIAFVGLVIPHILRLTIGPDHFRLLPMAALVGASFLVLTDTVARTVFAPTEIPVGILTAFIGGPMFLYLLRQKRRA